MGFVGFCGGFWEPLLEDFSEDFTMCFIQFWNVFEGFLEDVVHAFWNHFRGVVEEFVKDFLKIF